MSPGQGLSFLCHAHPLSPLRAVAGPQLFLSFSFPHSLPCGLVCDPLLFYILHSFILSPSIEHRLEFETVKSNLPTAQIGKLRLRKE